MVQTAAPCVSQAHGARAHMVSKPVPSSVLEYSTRVLDGITRASPVRTSSPRWFVHTVRRRMRFFSRFVSSTSTRAVTMSPNITGLRNLRDCER